MNKWRKLYEIKDWKLIELEVIDYNCNDDGTPDISKCKYNAQEGTMYFTDGTGWICIGNNFEKECWREAEPRLPTYDEWLNNNSIITACIENGKGNEFIERNTDIFTSRELLRRYIQHLADILNDGWVPNWSTNESKFHILMDFDIKGFLVREAFSCMYDIIYFKSEIIAKQILDHAKEQLEELYEVENII